MDEATLERIRHRAYEIWLEEGKPDGRDVEHWRRAEAEILGQAPSDREDERSVTQASANPEVLREKEPLVQPESAGPADPQATRPDVPARSLEAELDETKKRSRTRKAATTEGAQPKKRSPSAAGRKTTGA